MPPRSLHNTVASSTRIGSKRKRGVKAKVSSLTAQTRNRTKIGFRAVDSDDTETDEDYNDAGENPTSEDDSPKRTKSKASTTKKPRSKSESKAKATKTTKATKTNAKKPKSDSNKSNKSMQPTQSTQSIQSTQSTQSTVSEQSTVNPIQNTDANPGPNQLKFEPPPTSNTSGLSTNTNQTIDSHPPKDNLSNQEIDNSYDSLKKPISRRNAKLNQGLKEKRKIEMVSYVSGLNARLKINSLFELAHMNPRLLRMEGLNDIHMFADILVSEEILGTKKATVERSRVILILEFLICRCRFWIKPQFQSDKPQNSVREEDNDTNNLSYGFPALTSTSTGSTSSTAPSATTHQSKNPMNADVKLSLSQNMSSSAASIIEPSIYHEIPKESKERIVRAFEEFSGYDIGNWQKSFTAIIPRMWAVLNACPVAEYDRMKNECERLFEAELIAKGSPTDSRSSKKTDALMNSMRSIPKKKNTHVYYGIKLRPERGMTMTECFPNSSSSITSTTSLSSLSTIASFARQHLYPSNTQTVNGNGNGNALSNSTTINKGSSGNNDARSGQNQMIPQHTQQDGNHDNQDEKSKGQIHQMHIHNKKSNGFVTHPESNELAMSSNFSDYLRTHSLFTTSLHTKEIHRPPKHRKSNNSDLESLGTQSFGSGSQSVGSLGASTNSNSSSDPNVSHQEILVIKGQITNQSPNTIVSTERIWFHPSIPAVPAICVSLPRRGSDFREKLHIDVGRNDVLTFSCHYRLKPLLWKATSSSSAIEKNSLGVNNSNNANDKYDKYDKYDNNDTNQQNDYRETEDDFVHVSFQCHWHGLYFHLNQKLHVKNPIVLEEGECIHILFITKELYHQKFHSVQLPHDTFETKTSGLDGVGLSNGLHHTSGLHNAVPNPLGDMGSFKYPHPVDSKANAVHETKMSFHDIFTSARQMGLRSMPGFENYESLMLSQQQAAPDYFLNHHQSSSADPNDGLQTSDTMISLQELSANQHSHQQTQLPTQMQTQPLLQNTQQQIQPSQHSLLHSIAPPLEQQSMQLPSIQPPVHPSEQPPVQPLGQNVPENTETMGCVKSEKTTAVTTATSVTATTSVTSSENIESMAIVKTEPIS